MLLSKVISISCGQTSSMVALENGEVYAWGYNGNGQLGLGNNINQLNACKITTLAGIVITKVQSTTLTNDTLKCINFVLKGLR